MTAARVARARAPPMPGNNLPESFTPVLRLMIDSARSPITAAKPSSSPKMVAWVQFNAERCPGINLKSARLANNENPIAPKNPSHVFFGLMCGISGCRPMTLPVRYAPMSLNFVIAIK